MNCTDWNESLHDHVDGTLSASDTLALERHLAACSECRAELASLRALRAATSQLARNLAPPHNLWPEIQREISPSGGKRAVPARVHFLPLLRKLAASVAILLALAVAWQWRARASSPAWQIASLAGAPRLDTKSFRGESHLHVGQWLETDSASRVKIAVGTIGEVRIEPNSRVRLVVAAPTDHRLELSRGRLSALIWAPPRLFFVDTPSATAVDLGCAYTLEVAESGAGLLHVTAGYVALEHGGRETVISAGQFCATRRGAGPGTPFVIDAPDGLRHSLERFDFENDATALTEILAQARAADAVTVWNLLTRVPVPERGAVFDALARDHLPPAGVTRPGILAGDLAMINRWAADLGLLGVTAPTQ